MQKIGMFSIVEGLDIIPLTILKTSEIKIKEIDRNRDVAKISFFKKPLVVEQKNISNEPSIFQESNLNREIKISELNISKDIVVDVVGYSKGKGFCGVIKKYNFAMNRKSHGVSLAHRSRGSCGSCKPNRVRKNTKMSGRHGNKKTTVKNLKILNIIDSKNTIAIKGSIPGCNGSLVFVKLNKK